MIVPAAEIYKMWRGAQHSGRAQRFRITALIMSTILSARSLMWGVGAVPILVAICALLPYVSRCFSKGIAETAEVKTETSLTTRTECKLRKQHQAALGKKFRKRRVTKSIPAFMFRFLRRTVVGLEAAVDHYQVILCMFMAI